MARTRISIREVWAQRRPERLLFFFSFLVVGAGLLMIISSKAGRTPSTWQELAPLGFYLFAMIFIHLLLVVMKFRGDPILLSTVFLLSGFGILARYRMGSFEDSVMYNLSDLALPGGMALMLLMILLFREGRFSILESLHLPSAFAAILILSLILIFGRRYRGAMFMPGYSNPADFIRIFLVIYLCGFFVRKEHSSKRNEPSPSLISLAFFWGSAMALLFFQRDLGMLVLMNAVLILLFYTATGRISILLWGITAGLLLALAIFLFSLHGQSRFQAWFDPFLDSTGKGWQILQALSALYSGGLWGVGLGEGSPHAIPIAASDFIYAVIGEELGFVGCGIVLIVFLFFFHRGYRIAMYSKSLFGRLLATGIVSTLAFQTLLNIGGVVKALPLTGITLPFISRGGSSLVTSFVGAGLLLALSEAEKKGSR